MEDSPLPPQSSVRASVKDLAPVKDLASTPELEVASARLATAIDSYLGYYAQGSSHTARAKQLDLQHFVEFMCAYKGVSCASKLTLSDWDQPAVQRFVDERLMLGESPATVARRLATLKHMGRTYAERCKGFINPAKEVKTPKVLKGKPKSLSSAEVSKARQIASSRQHSKDSFARLRNHILFEFLVETGLRAEEVRLLKFGQLDPELEWAKNVRTKGRRYRNVYINSDFRPSLQQYLEARMKELERFYKKLPMDLNKAHPVFISSYNCTPGQADSFMMGAKSIWRAINEMSAEIHLHPHLLRHSYALELLDSSRDVRLVAQALGHSDVRITMRYTERRDEEVAAAIEQRCKDRKRT